MPTFIYNIIGFFGDFFVLIAYSLLQFKKLKAESFLYSFLNLIGAIFLLFSLYYAWNLPAAIIEGTWVLISFYGLIQGWRARTKKIL